MSRYNHNYNDPEAPDFKEIYSKYLNDFIKDVEFLDVHLKLSPSVLTEEECRQIKEKRDVEQQIVLMFTLLVDRNKNLANFLKVINEDFSWLYQKIRQDQLMYTNGNKEMQIYLNVVHEMTSHFPKYTNFNIRRINYYCKLRNFMRNLKPRQYLVVSGELGFGKKWLVLDVCRDFGVSSVMNFKIFWLNVYNCDSPEMDLEKLQSLKILLGNSFNRKETDEHLGMSNRILEIQQHIKNILREDDFKDCLLILSNVQNRKTLEAFNFPCKIVIITRNKKITEGLPTGSTKILSIAEGFNVAESLELFEKILQKPKSSFPCNCSDLFEQCKGHPFLLTMIAQNLKGRSNKEWDEWIKNLDDFQIRNDKISDLIKLSLEVLTDKELKFYHTFSIFNHSVKIPITLLAAFWDMEESDTINLVKKFDKFSLISITEFKSEKMACCLHFLYYSYLQNCSNIDKEKLNRKLVDRYKLEIALKSREDLELSLPDDDYFYYYIGYHLKSANIMELFSTLYLDFGFLEQKLRATGLPNTIGDLKYFRNEITRSDIAKDQMLEALLDFLPNVEEMIFKSKDTCLLQYALMTDRILRSAASKQACNYPQRIWFRDSDHFHRRRQMVCLRKNPKLLRLVDPDTCITALEDCTIFFADLSYDYNSEPTSFIGHENAIQNIQFFAKNYVISLDSEGVVMVWSIEQELRRNITQKQSSRPIARQIDYSTMPKTRQKECLQTIHLGTNHPDLKVRCFYLENIEMSCSSKLHLHLAFTDGDIRTYTWNEKKKMFEKDYTPPLKTNDRNICFILKVLDEYMILNNSGNIVFFNLIDGSKTDISCKWVKNSNPVNIHYFARHLEHVIIFVFEWNIVQLLLPAGQPLENLVTEPIDYLYAVDDRSSSITCSALSEDCRYLIIGTTQGILVFDVLEKCEILRNCVSEHIVCLDICSQDDEIYKYVIVSGSQNEAKLNMFGMKLLTNDNNYNNRTTVNLNIQLKPNTWLVGQQLFDVFSNYEGQLSVVAVDSKNCIHHLKNNQSSTWESFPHKITAIAASHNEYLIGCQNGEVHRSSKTKLLNFLTPNKITFLKYMDNDIIIASTSDDSIIFRNQKSHRLDIGIKRCFLYQNKYLVLVTHTCAYTILNVEKDFDIIENKQSLANLGDSDMKANTLVIATEKSIIYFYEFCVDEKDFLKISCDECQEEIESSITSVALSSDGGICAVGCENGLIYLFKHENQWEEIQKLKSHVSRIFELKFSTWNHPNLPIILASISEQLCFWNVTFIINNPLERWGSDKKRFSSRFYTKGKNLVPFVFPLQDEKANTSTNVWCNKRGSTDKPELLSCIKFIGSIAEKFYVNEEFTKFVTIDNEGEVYFLSIDETFSNVEKIGKTQLM